LPSIIIEALAGYSMGDIILDAEMVAYSDERHKIEGNSTLHVTIASSQPEFIPEFWHIRGLIARTAVGARAGGYRRSETQHDSRTQHVFLSCP
jgi:DNA ligase-4